MKIEVLFPEAANLFGDCWNHRYLKECLPGAEFVYTSFGDTPEFVNGDVQLVYMGAMTESAQERAIEKLMPYRERVKQLVDGGTVFLMTANAGEIFCDYIENEDGSLLLTDAGGGNTILRQRLPELDARFEAERQRLQAEHKCWRFVARWEDGHASVGLEEIPDGHPFYVLEGSNNIITLTTERYREYPMLIQGYGAGADVTAAGVFADIMRVANI